MFELEGLVPDRLNVAKMVLADIDPFIINKEIPTHVKRDVVLFFVVAVITYGG